MTAVAALVAAVLAQAPARDLRPHVRLELDECLPVSLDEVRRILAIELHAALDEEPDPALQTTVISLGCKGGLTTLHVVDPITGKSLDRTIALPELAPKARPRLLALAAAELVTASWTEAQTDPQPQVPPAGPPVPEESRQAVRAAVEARTEERERHAWILSAQLGARGASAGPVYGGALGLRYDALAWGGFCADATALYGTASSPLGLIAQTNLSLGLSAYARWTTPRYAVRAGLGARGGPVWLVGQPFSTDSASGRTLFGFWAGPLASAGFDVPIGHALSVQASLEAGYVARSVTALVNGEPAVAVDGPWAAVNVGVGWGI